MSYSLSQSRGSIKLLLQSQNLDTGTLQNPTYILNQGLNAPSDSFALIGVDKMVFTQSPMFPSQTFNITIAIRYLNTSTNQNILFTDTINGSDFVYGQSTLNGAPKDGYPQLMDFQYSQDGNINAIMFDNILKMFNRKTDCPVTFDLWSPSFDNSPYHLWSGTTNKYADGLYYGAEYSKILYLVWTLKPNVSFSFIYTVGTPNTIVPETFTYIQITDTTGGCWNQYLGDQLIRFGKSANYGTSYLNNNSTGGLTMGQVNNPLNTTIVSSLGYIPDGMTAQLGIKLNLPCNAPLTFIKVMCNLASGFRQSRKVVTGVANTTLLCVIPINGNPGDTETYISSQQVEKLTVNQMSMDNISLSFLDQDDNPVTLKNFAVVLGIDYMDKDPVQNAPTMYSGRGRI